MAEDFGLSTCGRSVPVLFGTDGKVDSRAFVDTLYNTVRTGDKSIAADSTLAANATSQFTPIVRWRKSETASTVAGTTGSRYANGCQIIVKRG